MLIMLILIIIVAFLFMINESPLNNRNATLINLIHLVLTLLN